VVGPALWSIVLSFQDRDLTRGGDVGWAGFRNYASWLSEGDFYHSLWLSVAWTVGSVLLQAVVGLAVALLLHQPFHGRGLVRALVLLPWVLPIVSTANIWLWLFNATYGFFNTALIRAGAIDRPILWLASPDLALLSAIVVKTWREFPFAALVLLAGLQAIPDDLYEASKVDGASAWQRFRSITLPGLRLVLLVVMLLQTIWTFNDFSTVYLLTRGGPGDSTEILPISVFQRAFVGGDLSGGAAGAVLMFLAVCVLIAGYLRTYNRSEEEVRA
jgi:multiple sugar transport system permease protein